MKYPENRPIQLAQKDVALQLYIALIEGYPLYLEEVDQDEKIRQLAEEAIRSAEIFENCFHEYQNNQFQ